MELMDIKKEDKLIYQHNVITSGRYDYSACMLDILFMVLSGLEKDKLEYNIHVQDIEIITGRKWNLKQLRESTENIGSRMFEIETPESFEQLWLFSRVKYLKGTGSFTVKLNDEAMPYFFDLKNNFTSMQLKSVLNCSSKYAKRLYAIACQWRSVGIKRFEIEELKKMLGLIDKKGNEQFERISDFKKFVLDVAREQISENTDIELDFELKKRGRSFHWITLHINNQKFKQLEIDFNKPLEIQKFISKLMAYGFSEEQANIISDKEKESNFDILIAELNEKIKTKKLSVRNSIGYLVGVYQKKGILPIKE
ncbi:replication initiation protein [Riemerella anatipestifer]|uniref:Replication initiation protein n=1 Tax=Riemerella anatipestifer TaxID=34085 RepID=A0AAP3EUX7_RIEAN|nr:replication initiation protein [Riemerella anatipestifer]AVW80131.1 replicase [Riemerella anatipestifer]MBT0552612.1 replication initiation protein [Riemerella anatipestifer]MBT0554904.1 replication initiation protein [Riemerella anatipestifer]MBT0574305.1 replication initiation protein [Riemerella anatipestifer]MCO7319645.1 replication initiation protein [Riemerella anatipestifer]